MNGFRAELLGRILGLNGHISVYARATQHIPDYEMLVNRIRGMRDVVAVAPQVQGHGAGDRQRRRRAGAYRGMRAADIRDRKLINDNIKQGSLDDFTDDSVLIGRRMAQRMGLRLGDLITFINPRQ